MCFCFIQTLSLIRQYNCILFIKNAIGGKINLNQPIGEQGFRLD